MCFIFNFFFLFQFYSTFFSISIPNAIFYTIGIVLNKKKSTYDLRQGFLLKINTHNSVFLGFSLTSSRSVHLSQVPRRRHGRHDQIERDGNVHGAHRVRPSPDHANLIMGLEVHIRWTS